MNAPDPAILCICTGNICRSPMAEYLVRRALPSNAGWQVISAGLMAVHGQPASRDAVSAMRELEIDISPHRSRPVTRDLVDSAFCIVVMTAAHSAQFGDLYPDARDRVHLIRSFDPNADCQDVDDPIGMSLSVYRKTRDAIGDAVPGLIKYLNSLEPDIQS